MNKLTKILLAETIAFSLGLNAYSEEKTIKELTTDFAKIVLYNRVKEEQEVPLFLTSGKRKDYVEIISKSDKINYSVQKDENILYFSIFPEKERDTRIVEFDNYYRVGERTKLAISYPKENRIVEISQQGLFIKQDPFNERLVFRYLNGLIKLEEHEEATKILDIGDKVVKKVISKGGNTVLKKYEEFVLYSKEKENTRIKNKIKLKDENTLSIILTDVPYKLTGKKMVSLEYKIVFEKEVKNVTVYSMLGLDEREIIHKVINLKK